MHAVIFDIDGTLLHSAAKDDALYREAALQVLGDVQLRPSLHDYDFITDAGILSQILADNSMPANADVQEQVKSCFVAALQSHLDANGSFTQVPGAGELLQSLRESEAHALAFATGGWRESAELKLQSAGLNYEGLPLATANDHQERTGIMKIALAKLGTEFESVTYYGDGPWDRSATTELGWRFVPVGPEVGGIDSYAGHRPATHSVRPMLASDMEGVFHVRTSVVDNHMDEDELRDIGITRDSVIDDMATERTAGWVAVSGGSVVGFSVATKNDREINALFVLPECNGSGIGRELLDAAVQYLRCVAPGPIRLRTDPASPAFNFYLRRGWRDTGEDLEDAAGDSDRFLELE